MRAHRYLQASPVAVAALNQACERQVALKAKLLLEASEFRMSPTDALNPKVFVEHPAKPSIARAATNRGKVWSLR